MFGNHLWDLVPLILLALLFFGPKKLPEIGSSVGKTIKEFQKSIREVSEPAPPPTPTPTITAARTVTPQLPAAPASTVSAPVAPAALPEAQVQTPEATEASAS